MKMKYHNQILYIIFIFVLILMALSLLSSVIRADENENEKTTQPRVTIMLFETDIKEALNEISLQTGVNIIPDQTVSGLVTVDIQDTPLEKALQQVLIGGGYTYRKIEDFYLVGLPDPQSRTFSDLAEIEVIELKNVTVEEVTAILPDFLQDYVRGSRTGNKLTITAPGSEITRLINIIKKIDEPQKMIEIRLLVTEINKQELEKLGINRMQYNELEEDKKVLDSFSYDIQDNLLIMETGFYGYLLTRLNFLEKEEKAKITADPRVVVNDGETAELFIGQNRVVVLGVSAGGTRTEKIETGVGMEVTPDIIGEDEINLSIATDVSHYVEEIKPDVTIRRNTVKTNLHLHNGQTLVFAGMTRQEDFDYAEKVPVLGDIPLVRWLFRSETKKNSERELLIFITPVIQ